MSFNTNIGLVFNSLTNHLNKAKPTSDESIVNRLKNKIFESVYKSAFTLPKGPYSLCVPGGAQDIRTVLGFASVMSVTKFMNHIFIVIPTDSIEVCRQIAEYVDQNLIAVSYSESNKEIPIHIINYNDFLKIQENLSDDMIVFCNIEHNVHNGDDVDVIKNIITTMTEDRGCTVLVTSNTGFSINTIFDIHFFSIVPDFNGMKRIINRNPTTTFLGNVNKYLLANRVRREWESICILNTDEEAESLVHEFDHRNVFLIKADTDLETLKNYVSQIRNIVEEKDRCTVVCSKSFGFYTDISFPTVFCQKQELPLLIQAEGIGDKVFTFGIS